MAIVDLKAAQPKVDLSTAQANGFSEDRPLHRIQEVRMQQNVSVRSAGRQLDVETSQVRQQEDPQADLQLSALYAWQRVLQVPVADLLVDLDAPLSAPVLKRAQMLRLMKTAITILEKAGKPQVRRLAQMMVDQLVEIMPELENVSAWHEVGQRRTRDEYGRIVERCLPDDLLFDPN
jgi:hypothetical protein